MQNEDVERAEDAVDQRRESVEAADDTGMVRQQEFLNDVISHDGEEVTSRHAG